MNKSFLIVATVFLLSSCAKRPVSETDHLRDTPPDIGRIKTFFESSYEFKIEAKKNLLTFKESGYRDILGGVSVKGSMEIGGGDKLEYDHLYDNVNWYKRKTLEKELYNQPIDPLNIIENFIIGDLKLVSEGKGKYLYETEINVAIADPLNYSSKGYLKTNESVDWIQMGAESGELEYTIELKKKNFKPISIPQETKIKCTAEGSKGDLKRMEIRLEESNTGRMKNGIAEFFFDEYSTFEQFLQEDSLKIYSYEYIDPSVEGADIAFIQGDVRNTVKKKEKLLSLKTEVSEVFSEGRTYEVVFKNIIMDDYEKIIFCAGSLAFPAYYEPKTKELRISGLKEREMLLMISLGETPYLDGKITLNKEE
ncbi:MAG: hypothetical protein AB7T10_00035 [bacterium]